MNKEVSNWQDFKRIIKMLGRNIIPFAFGIVGMTIGYCIMPIVSSLVYQKIIDGISAKSVQLLLQAIYIGLIGLLVRIVLAPVCQYLYNTRAKWGLANVRQMLMDKTGRLPMSYYENNHTGDLIARLLYDTNRMCEIYTSRLRRFIAPIISGICYLIPMLIMDWRITLAMVIINLILLFINRKFAKPIKQVSSQLSKENSKLAECFTNLLAGIFTVRIFQIAPIINEKYVKANKTFTQTAKKRINISSLLSGVNTGFEIINSFAFLAVGALLVQSGTTTMGRLIGLVTLQGSFTRNFLQVGRYLPELFDCLASARRIFSFLELEEEPEHYPMPSFEPQGFVEFKDIDFTYDNERKILSGFSMSIEKSVNVALAGMSGSGKSTIAKLLLGFYPPTGGSIAIDGKTFAQRSLRQTRQLIAYVPQEPYLYNVSIMENIRYGRPGATDEEVIDAAKTANAHDFIIEQPDGYQTVAGERGTLLSGGQRQRIAIARAVLRNAPILLFDEATSALDNESEHIIQEAINKLSKQHTTIMIAHRPSTIDSADRVIYMGAENINQKVECECLP